ncbi:MerR family transcriptional regulator [Candidatus Babeliales bacterium]|nr:MerR family transcriptional regulator [Candidatus Babeliales bacterium]
MMKKDRFKIGDVARELNIKKSLIRQWEKEFRLSSKNQNTYTVEDMKVLVHIKELVRTKGLSSTEVKAELEKLPELKELISEKEPLQLTKKSEKLDMTLNTESIKASVTSLEKITVAFNQGQANKRKTETVIQKFKSPEFQVIKKQLDELKEQLSAFKDLLN